MAQAYEFKSFLYTFCGKRKVQPTYIVEQEGSGFYCEVRRPTYSSRFDREIYLQTIFSSLGMPQ